MGTILNLFCDSIYNRSVITIAGTPDGVKRGVVAAVQKALSILPALADHVGGHPRQGTIDLIPIHPVTNEMSLAECGQVAVDITKCLNVLSGSDIDVFNFGFADIPRQRSLVTMRKTVGWYKPKPPKKKHGLVGIGAIPYMTNFNVTINTADIDIGKTIAASIRGSNPHGLLGVQSMAFPHIDGFVEVACNVDLFKLDLSNQSHQLAHQKGDVELAFSDEYYMTKLSTISAKIEALAQSHRKTTIKSSTVIGFTALEAGDRARHGLKTGNSWMVQEKQNLM